MKKLYAKGRLECYHQRISNALCDMVILKRKNDHIASFLPLVTGKEFKNALIIYFDIMESI